MTPGHLPATTELCKYHGIALQWKEAQVAGGWLLVCPLLGCQYSRMPVTAVFTAGDAPKSQNGHSIPAGLKPSSGNKYRNEKTELDGIVFDSAKEAKRWTLLTLMERTGEITHLQRQVRYDFVVNNVKCGYYKADFVYEQNGATVVEDTKSEVTAKLPQYRLKKKLMFALYGINIQEV